MAMSFLQRNNQPPPLDIESPGTRDDQKLLGSPFDKLAPMVIGGHDGNGYRGLQHQQQQGSPVSPTSPLVYCPRSPSLGRKSRAFRPGTTRKYRKRAILKNGECNITTSKVSQQHLRFLQDIFTTLVDAQWRWTLLVFAFSFIGSWLFFAVIWWLIAFTHGDLEEMHLPDNQAENGWVPCVFNIQSFTSCFLFSIETQHTIGYGVRTTTEECPEAIFIMCFQSIYGVMIQAFMVGIVFAKMTRPKHRTQTLLFSKQAVICQRDGELSFEIVVILEGTVESTGQSTQARSSYVNAEILWGHRFEPVVFYNKESQGYEINYSRFDETTQVDTPLCSARELAEFYKIQDDYRSNAEDQSIQSPA